MISYRQSDWQDFMKEQHFTVDWEWVSNSSNFHFDLNKLKDNEKAKRVFIDLLRNQLGFSSISPIGSGNLLWSRTSVESLEYFMQGVIRKAEDLPQLSNVRADTLENLGNEQMYGTLEFTYTD